MKTVYLKCWLPASVLILTILLMICYEITQPVAAIRSQFFIHSLLFVFCTVILIVIFIKIFNHLINNPIQHLTSVVQNFFSNTEARSQLTGQGELTVLGDSFNRLMDHLAETQHKLNKHKNLYELLSSASQLIIRLDSQQQLFDAICKNVIKQPHLILVWIGLVNQDNQKVDILAKAGAATNYLTSLVVSTNPALPEGQGPTATAIRENTHVVNNHFQESLLTQFWLDIAVKENICASAAFPICKFGRPIGAFNIYADLPDFFSTDIVELLKEMAADISYALENQALKEQRQQAEVEIERLAYYDSLTCLPNRKLLSDRLADEILIAERHDWFGAILFLDLDHFKNLNDSLGHAIGDELLVQFAERLKHQLRKSDFAARLGGDEFVILLTNLGDTVEKAIDSARKATEKILEVLRAPYSLKNYYYHSNSSVGIALFPQQQQNASEILKQADTALYQVKASGRNTFQFYHPQMQEAAYKRLEMEKNLRLAISEQQLLLYYQPQFNHSRQLVGAEVLLRWIHPEQGFITPDQFVPLAEESGLIIEIGNWIFNSVFNKVRVWQETGLLKPHQHISINVSPKQFEQDNFFALLSNIIAETGVSANAIILELTEGAFLSNIDVTIEKMLQLRGLGFTFSVDDFGTGYSSLSYLKRLPLNELKIDKAFIDDLEHDIDDQAIVKTIIAMSQHLKLSVIAEGVETQPQLSFLQENGCLNYQGYFFSQPLDQSSFENYLRQQQ